MKRFLQLNKIPLLLVFTAAAFYFSFGYDLERIDFPKLLGLYIGLFFLSWKIIQLKKGSFWFLAGAALLFRLIFFFAIPNLSQDYYRFIWDGRMLLAGYNPYLSLPVEWIASNDAPISQASALYRGMGEMNGGNYSNYPPLNQVFFALAAVLGGKSMIGPVIAMRLFIILADVGILLLGRKLLEKFNLPVHRIFWFILNPFVIIELTGNLHFEGVMLFFLLLSLFLLTKQKVYISAVAFAFSILLKLIPLMLLPLFYHYFKDHKKEKEKVQGLKDLVVFYLVVGLVTAIGFSPFLSTASVMNFASSIGLWFQRFEFNAGIYYIVRWIGYRVEGYNILVYAGKVLPVIVFLIILGLAFIRKNNSLKGLITAMLLGVSTYLFLSTTVHPWYLATPLLLSVFTGYRYVLVWSLLVVLSYYAYSQPGYSENLWLVGLEYTVVLGFFLYEIVTATRQGGHSSGSFKRYRLRT